MWETDEKPSPFVQELEEAVSEARKNREWRHEYMTLLMRDQENLERGREEGRQEGRLKEREEGIRKMISALGSFGISREEIKRKLQEEYQLTEQELERYRLEE
ncbi:MAG TPA: hypothetical protein IAC37_02300 [Candidatus Ventrimonas merdavium]|nr:hypothetical protein [Candidatus Ventrimonas merdavium]